MPTLRTSDTELKLAYWAQSTGNVFQMSVTSITLDRNALSPLAIKMVSRDRSKVLIAGPAKERVQSSRETLTSFLDDGLPHYGINTGFGALGKIRIDDASLQQLQTNLIRSHSTGVGPSLDTETVRATMLLLAASLCRGHSGIRLEVIQLITELLNHGITPVVPEIGSVGASGDLAPLSHIAQVLIGEGEADYQGKVVPGSQALKLAGLKPVQLAAKEGLALINGTHLMAGRGALLVHDFERLFHAAMVAAAMSMDSCRTTDTTLDPRIHLVRNQPGQKFVAATLRLLLQTSTIMKSHREDDPRVQDPYSFRCCPAVLGSAWDSFQYAKNCIENELGAVTDNPLVFSGQLTDGTPSVVSGGNFHGMPVALPMDVLAIGLSHVAGISERRVYHMLSGHDSEAELPTFLAPQAGLQSGLMIAQYTAAACCNEMIGLSNPASVANLSTSAGMEDYNSFGPRSAAKASRSLALARSVVAIEMLCASTGLDYHRPLHSGAEVEKAYQKIRSVVPPLTEDRSPAPDISAIEKLIFDGEFLIDLDTNQE